MKSLMCTDLDVIVEEICERIEVYSTVKGFNEANTIFLMIDPLLPGLGWDYTDIKEFHKEYSPKGVKKRVDISLMDAGVPKLSLEAKSLGTNLDQDEWINQVCNNAYQTGAPWALLTNGIEYRLYRIRGVHDNNDRMLLSFNINDADRAATMKNLKWISREMLVDKDNLLCEAHDKLLKDRQLAALAHDPTLVPGFIALASKACGLSEEDTASFFQKHRSKPEVESFIAASSGDVMSEILNMAVADDPVLTKVKDTKVDSPSSEKMKKVSMLDIFNAGYIKPGTILYLTGHEGEEVTVHDGKNCNWNGLICSYNHWATTVSDGSIKEVYARAVIKGGRSIRKIRAEMERKRVPVQSLAIEGEAVPTQSESMALT